MQFFAMTMFNGCHEPANIATAAINLVTPRRSKYEYAECDNATMLRRGGLPLFIGPCGVRLIVVCAVQSVIDSPVYGANCDYSSYVSVRKYKQMKIATELHRPKRVSLLQLDAILRDDVLCYLLLHQNYRLIPNFGLQARLL